MESAIFVFIALMLVELALSWVRPTWLLLPRLGLLDETRFSVRLPAPSAGHHRIVVSPLLVLPPRLELSSSRLYCDGRRLRLRSTTQLGSREAWLLPLEVSLEGDVVTLRAWRALFPLSLLGMAGAAGGALLRTSLVLAAGVPLVIGVVLWVQHLAWKGHQEDAVLEAFNALERVLREGL